MIDASMLAQELTNELLEWQRGKDPVAVVPALLVAAAKVAVASGESEQPLEQMLSLLSVVFGEEREKYTRRPLVKEAPGRAEASTPGRLGGLGAGDRPAAALTSEYRLGFPCIGMTGCCST